MDKNDNGYSANGEIVLSSVIFKATGMARGRFVPGILIKRIYIGAGEWTTNSLPCVLCDGAGELKYPAPGETAESLADQLQNELLHKSDAEPNQSPDDVSTGVADDSTPRPRSSRRSGSGYR